MAEEIAAFDADDYWNSGECWQAGYYDSKEAFMEDWLLETEEDFRECLLEEWLDSQWWDYWDGQRVERTRAQLGGVAGQVGVMVDGTYVQFPDAVPEVVNGRTMVPCRQVLEAFGGTVTYENGEAVCRLEGVTMRFKDGRDTAAMTLADGTETIVQMDVPCYYKNGRTYIPVRFFAEALGCDVLWDGAYDTAVILRRDKITAELDSRFTVLNRFLEAMRSGAMEPKRLRFVQVRADRAPSLVLAEGCRGGKPGLTVEAPLILQYPDGSPTAELDAIYFRQQEDLP